MKSVDRMCFHGVWGPGWVQLVVGVPGVFIAVVRHDSHHQHDDRGEGAHSGHHSIIEP